MSALELFADYILYPEYLCCVLSIEMVPFLTFGPVITTYVSHLNQTAMYS